MQKILICTDGSNYSQEVCRYGAYLAQQSDASIDVLYVTDLRQFEVPAVADFSGSLGIQPFEGMVNQLREIEEIKSKFVEENALKTLKDSGVSTEINFHYETGMLVDIINEYANNTDLVILGKRGENVNFATQHLGSMLERALRVLSKPCLVTNREFKAFNKVAVAYDGGDSCKKALDYISKNELLKSLDLHVISCVEGHKESLATERLSEAESILHKAEIYPTCQILSGVVETAISDYVEKSQIDLLILGAYGHSRIRELLIGSTTTELLRGCHVPVLCFR